MKEILLRFLIGGTVVSVFALMGDLFKPKSFAGLFGGAPSVALATLGLTAATQGAPYAAAEAHAMMGGAVAFLVYASCVSAVMMHHRVTALPVAVFSIPVWFATAFGFWYVWLR